MERHSSPRRYRILGVAILVPLAIVALIPSWPYTAAARSSVPYFFRSAQVKEVPVGSTILTYPFPQYPQNQAMAWQAVSGMRFKEVGTYAILRAANGRATFTAQYLPPTSVQRYHCQERFTGATTDPRIPTAKLVVDIRTYISTYHISAVIIQVSDPVVPGVSEVRAVFNALWASRLCLAESLSGSIP